MAVLTKNVEVGQAWMDLSEALGSADGEEWGFEASPHGQPIALAETDSPGDGAPPDSLQGQALWPPQSRPGGTPGIQKTWTKDSGHKLWARSLFDTGIVVAAKV